jgi:hypothetical protein
MSDGTAPAEVSQRADIDRPWFVSALKRNAGVSWRLPRNGRLVRWVRASDLPNEQDTWYYMTLLPDDNSKGCRRTAVSAIDRDCSEISWNDVKAFE